jgi:hypothetical protein
MGAGARRRRETAERVDPPKRPRGGAIWASRPFFKPVRRLFRLYLRDPDDPVGS